MEKWGMFEFNTPYVGEIIEKINDVVLPNDYIEFMKKHNGGQGDIGETWLILYRLEELQEINDDYEIEVFLPDHIIIGSNGGGELYGIDNKGNYFNVPVLIDEDDVAVLAHQLNDEALPPQISQLIEMFDLKLDDTLKSRLGYFDDAPGSNVLSQQHTEVRCGQRAWLVGLGEVYQGQACAGRYRETQGFFIIFYREHQLILLRLGNLVDLAAL